MSGANSNGIGIGTKSVQRWRNSSPRATSSTTENPMDLAINGSGFFQLTDGLSPRQLLSRNGQFKIDRDGYIVNNSGCKG